MESGDIIFLVDEQSGLIAMQSERYESEDILQTIVANYPEVLAGGESGTTKRLSLVKREKPIADGDTSGARWSLDHLFLDQDGIPTLVEVKRSTDTRIRREVVGQMLDYAANGVRYWPIDDLRQEFAVTHAERGPDRVLAELAGDDVDPEAFWLSVGDNLAAGRIRMVFLADEIPTDLQRIIEFLNEQMSRAEVIGVEIKQYVGGGHQTLVPRRVGATAQAQQAKWTRPKKGYAELIAEAPEEVRQMEELMLAWAEQSGCLVRRKPASIGVGSKEGLSLMQFYPQPEWQSVDLHLKALREAGLGEEADWVRDACSELLNKRLTSTTLSLPVLELLPRWSDFTSTVLPKYLEYTAEAWKRKAERSGTLVAESHDQD